MGYVGEKAKLGLVYFLDSLFIKFFEMEGGLQVL